MSELERRFTSVPVELRTKQDTHRIGGYAAKFRSMSQNLGGFVEVIAPAFFNDSRSRGWPDVMARYNHDDNMLLGTTGGGTLRLMVDETGLDYEVDLPESRSDIAELVSRGDVRKSSFAFRTLEDEWSTTDQGFPLRTLITGALVDVAPVNSRPTWTPRPVSGRWRPSSPRTSRRSAASPRLTSCGSSSTAPTASRQRRPFPWSTPAR
jgi:HK97 family phage prohead protease